MKFNILCLVLFFTVSCGQDLTSLGRGNSGRATSNSSVSELTCSCSDTYEPVCGTNGSITLTVRNGCIAQCNGLTYTTGSCEANQTVCNTSMNPVCGQPPCTGSTCPDPGVYNNECEMLRAGATQLDMSDCTSL